MASTKRDAKPVLQRFVFTGLVIGQNALIDAEDNEDRSTKHKGHERLRPIKQHDIEVTGGNYRSCKCERIGLHEGMTVDALIRMGCGCTEGSHWAAGYVCPRLVALRRMYGH